MLSSSYDYLLTMPLSSPHTSFSEQLPSFEHLALELDPPPSRKMSPITPKRPSTRRTQSLPLNNSILTTPGVRPEQVTLSSDPLGRGSFGSVWRGTFCGCPVAVKLCPLDHPSPTALTQFRREMSRYHHLRHPCITQFFCVVQHSGNLLLVTELMKGGSLFEALSLSRKAGFKRLQPSSMLRIAQHVTNGLAYLHASGFSFGDLKSMNVLLSERPNLENGSFSPSVQAKLCDFGLSRNLKHLITPEQKFSLFDTQIPARNGPAGTFAYLAPEAFSGLPVDQAEAPKAADVYALGIVLWEVATLRSPWPGKQPLQLLKLVRKEGRRPPWPTNTSGIPDDYISLVERCWHQDPALRPTVDVVAFELDCILHNLPEHMDTQQLSMYAGSTFCSRREDEAEGTSLSCDLEALRVEEHQPDGSTSSGSTQDDDFYSGLAAIRYVKSMRIMSPSAQKPSNSNLSACIAAFESRTNSQTKLTVDSFAPSVEVKGLELPRFNEHSDEVPKSKEQRMSFVSSSSGPDSRRGDHLVAVEASAKVLVSKKTEYKIPTPRTDDGRSIETEFSHLEEEEDLDVRRLGISMFSRPHFR